MKNIKYIHSIIILFTILSCNSQERNYLTLSEFNNITIDGVKWKDIDNTKGDLTKMKNLFGNNLIHKTADEPMPIISFWNNSFYFSFESVFGDSPYDLVRFKIKNNSSTISIKGISITLGDNINKLGNIKINIYSDGTKGAIFTLENSDRGDLLIECNPTTNRITKIEYNSY